MPKRFDVGRFYFVYVQMILLLLVPIIVIPSEANGWEISFHELWTTFRHSRSKVIGERDVTHSLGKTLKLLRNWFLNFSGLSSENGKYSRLEICAVWFTHSMLTLYHFAGCLKLTRRVWRWTDFFRRKWRRLGKAGKVFLAFHPTQ